MDPFTIALATFGVQKLRGKSTSRALRDAALLAGGAQLAGMGGIGGFTPFGSAATPGAIQGLSQTGIANLVGMGTTAPTLSANTVNPLNFTGEGFIGTGGALDPSLAGSSLSQSYSAMPTSFAAADVPVTSSMQNLITPVQEKPSFLNRLIGSSPVEGQAYKPEIVVDGVVKQPEVPYIAADKGSGFLGLSTGAKLGIGAAGLTAASALLPEEEEKPLPGTTPEERAAAQAAANEQIGGLTSSRGAMPTYSGSPYNYGSNYYRFNTGGIVSALPKFSVGGVNYLPSKQTHDENDVHNYVRATGYVEDGSGNGDKDEDTILAQLADGEFVSRADAILGAGIMEGASPSSMKDMRKKGAAFFYDQQAKFKRVYDLLDASRKNN
jgi:hypothetical protein